MSPETEQKYRFYHSAVFPSRWWVNAQSHPDGDPIAKKKNPIIVQPDFMSFLCNVNKKTFLLNVQRHQFQK